MRKRRVGRQQPFEDAIFGAVGDVAQLPLLFEIERRNASAVKLDERSELAKRVIQTALDRGTRDNLSALVVRLK